MSKEDLGREERFLHQKIDEEDITTLFEPKVLTDFRTIDQSGEQKLEADSEFEFFDEQGELKQNLLIKGNNLLALHTLKNRLAGKVKLIYIDPPYFFYSTKPLDSFKYNTNFKLSSWLVFIKNRLEIARDLLNSDGVILIHISEDGFAYLKILMNEIFGRDNFVETFIWKNTDNPDSLSKKSRASVEYIIAFEKQIDKSKNYTGKLTENDDAPLLNTGNRNKPLTFPAGVIKFNIPDGEIRQGKPDRVEIMNDFTIKDGVNKQTVTLSGEFKWAQDTLNSEIESGTYFLVKTNRFSVRFQRSDAKLMTPEKYIDDVYLSKSIGVGTNEDSNSHLKKLRISFSNAKPESIIAFFIRAITEKDDLVLDFFLGAGTTTAVAHKMGRRWIGIEQMDYIEEITKERLKKVIDGEQGGISKNVDWQGGGSFVYFELKKYNQEYIDQINAADSLSKLETLYTDLRNNGFLKFWFDRKEFEKDENFRNLTLEERKQKLIEILDENQLYLNYEDMEDTRHQVSDTEKALTNRFYGKKDS
ncbi:site-specific DNA-methyltransferase [Candidatus Nitrosacidococcus sp. I8]|uniref:site-specific DNA-methyltransferase n=1 Tax=Candidatus Nitrosacidococcus sp. I8 TaxID=2942908 RepID=UPI002227D356|nr:site-specific DNA-methyltransferase [Candidatus Nitrosacidococcus sp. I8]